MKKIAIALLSVSFLAGCTENIRAKNWGGTATVDLPKSTKLFDVTWKENEIWYTYRAMREDEFPETYIMQEQSSFGVIEGKVIFKESQ